MWLSIIRVAGDVGVRQDDVTHGVGTAKSGANGSEIQSDRHGRPIRKAARKAVDAATNNGRLSVTQEFQ
jgi:hypothetical protein